MHLSVTSAGYYTHDYGRETVIRINGVAVKIQPNENYHLRGMHIVIINPFNGKVEFAKAFDTHESSAAFDRFIFESIPRGYILAAACRDECLLGLSQEAKEFFANALGSREIWYLKYRQGFAFIGKAHLFERNERVSKVRKLPVTVE